MISELNGAFRIATLTDAPADCAARRIVPLVAPRRGLAARTGAALARIVRRIVFWRTVAAQRRLLLTMDERMLRDIGIDRYEALREARRPFWDIDG